MAPKGVYVEPPPKDDRHKCFKTGHWKARSPTMFNLKGKEQELQSDNKYSYSYELRIEYKFGKSVPSRKILAKYVVIFMI